MEIYGPPDVVGAVVAYLRGRGVDARTRVPVDRAPGMVRVSRVGGEPENAYQDRARVLVEVWEASQAASFDAARSLWAAFAVIETQDALPGLIAHHVAPAGMPLQFPDDHAVDLDRHQFEVDVYARMEAMEVTA